MYECCLKKGYDELYKLLCDLFKKLPYRAVNFSLIRNSCCECNSNITFLIKYIVNVCYNAKKVIYQKMQKLEMTDLADYDQFLYDMKDVEKKRMRKLHYGDL